MYGRDPLTMECVYKTPCGWCVKFEKECDKKLPCNHKWEPTGQGSGSADANGTSVYMTYQCVKCGETKEVKC